MTDTRAERKANARIAVSYPLLHSPPEGHRRYPEPPGCGCDGNYYAQHQDIGCKFYVKPKRSLRDRFGAAWRVFWV